MVTSRMEPPSSDTSEDLALYLYVDSILRTGIVSDNLTSAKSNSELVRSLESLLETSLACRRHPASPIPSSSSSIYSTVSLTKPDPALAECDSLQSWSTFTAKGKSSTQQVQKIVTIPATDAIRQEPAVKFPETREALDVTCKLFYLPGRRDTAEEQKECIDELDPAWVEESLEQLRIATGLDDVDTFIISFPGLVFDDHAAGSTCLNKDSHPTRQLSPADEVQLKEKILQVWRTASGNKALRVLGVSEFSLERLQWLFSNAPDEATAGVTSTEFRRPRVGQINTRDCCDVPSDLITYAQEKEVELLVHSDCSDFLPSQTFTRLLARYGSRLPAPLLAPLSNSGLAIDGSGPTDAEQLAREALDSLNSRWVLKYTVLIRDRALVADKGYIVKASRQ